MVMSKTAVSIDGLKSQVKGEVFTSDDAAYDRFRRGFNLSVDAHPTLILVAEDAADVIAGVRYAREAGLGVAVQSTGHGTQRPADESLLIVTSRMKGVQVNPETRTAHAEAGVVWQGVIDAAAPHGLAPLLGSSPHVGVVGYSLGGGIGWLGRRYGLAVDSVLWVDVVTADGELRRASATENSDLFWGLRGAGGNFGVITALGFKLYPVARLYGGNLVYPGEAAGEALRFFRDWVSTAPDELTSSIAILKYPSFPQIPEAMRGRIDVIVRAAYVGAAGNVPAEDGAAALQPWLDWRTPISSTLRDMPFTEIATISNDPVDPVPVNGSVELFRELTDETLALIVRHATNPASPLALTEIRHAGGAIKRADASANAFSLRDAEFYLQMGGPTPTPEMYAASASYIRQYRAELAPYRHGGAYLNFTSGAEALERGKEAYTAANYYRLLELKSRYDPENVFRYSYQLR